MSQKIQCQRKWNRKFKKLLIGFQQIIGKTTRIPNTSSFYIDLIFTSQSYLTTDSDVCSSLHPNCHHQIVFAKLNLHFVYLHLVYQRSSTTEKKTQDLLDFNWEEPSNNLTGKEIFEHKR